MAEGEQQESRAEHMQRLLEEQLKEAAQEQEGLQTDAEIPGDDEPSEEDGDDEQPEPEEEPGEDTDDDGDGEEEPAAAALEAPEHWPAADREKFATLNDADKGFLLDQAKRLEAKHQEAMEGLRGLDKWRGMDDVFSPYREAMAMSGLNEEATIRQLLAAQAYLQRDPVGALRYLAQQTGVDVASLAGGQEVGAEPDDPQLQSVRNELNQLKGYINTQAQQSRQAQLADAQAQIAVFRDAKSDGGELLHPHFDRVRGIMGELTRANGALSLQDAYDRAVWGDPELRADMLAREREAAAKQTAEADKARVKKAKRAGTAVKSRSGAKKPDDAAALVKNETRAQTMTRLLEQQMEAAE